MRPVVIGYGLALLLTAAAFGLAGTHALPRGPALGVLAALAVAQMAVHFRCFLGIGTPAATRYQVIALCFSAIVIAILTGGSLWVMFDLNQRMMM